MGNTIETKLKEENPVLEVTETLVGQFKDYISMADHSMAGLAKSMDAMRDACEMLLRQFDKGPQLQDATTGTESDKGNNEQLARHLLEMIDASVSDHKYVVMESISKLFNFVWDVGKRYTDNTENNPLVFLVDKYKSERNSVGVEDGVSYTDLRIRALQREKQILQDKYTTSEKELKILNRRESEYRKEIKILENENKAQKEKIEHLTEKQNSEVEDFSKITLNSDCNTDITDLKKENSSLKQEYEQFKKTMIVAKDVTEECLNQKEQKIKDLEQELQNLKMEDFKGLTEDTNMREEIERLNQELTALKTNKVLHDKVTSVEDLEGLTKETNMKEDKETQMEDLEGLTKDTNIREDKETSIEDSEGLTRETNIRENKETSMEDFEGLTKETNMREEIEMLNQKITALTTNKVLHGFEYDGWTYLSSNYFERDIRRDIYQSLESELAICNINLEIVPWRPSKLLEFPEDKVIIVPIHLLPYENLQDMMQKALKRIKAGANILVLVFYDSDRPLVCEEMNKPVGEEFNNLGGVFKFGHFTRTKPNTEMNDKNFKGLLQVLKSKCLERKYLSR